MGDDTSTTARRRTVLKGTAAVGAAATITTTVSADTGEELVRLNVGYSNAYTMASAESRVQSVTPSGSELYRRSEALQFLSIDVPADAAESLIEEFEAMERFRYAEFDQQLYMFETPDDALFDEQYAPQQVRAPGAYEKTMGSEDVTIAIVDQGVMYDHPDLQGQFGSNKGKDFVDDDDDPYPTSMSDEFHGTHVAGIASATTDNGTGIAGISNSTLLSARALGAEGGGSLADISEAIRWAADQGADIINMSLGGGGYTDTMKNAVSYAVENGALPICAAGNDGSEGVSYPAGYSECVAVSAVNENEDLADFSQYGDKTDVAAPGVDVLSAWTEDKSQWGGKYNKISGTSMACPAASGVAALGKAVNPEMGPNELRSRLKQTAVDIGLDDIEQGAGRVDAQNIVGEIDGEDPNAVIDTSATEVDVGTEVTFDGSESSDPDGSIESYAWDFDQGATATGETAAFTFENPGTFDVTLTVTDDTGRSDTASVAIAVTDDGNEAPSASIDASATEVEVGDEIAFDGSGSSDPDGSITSYDWAFGDEESASGESTTHAYADAGDYEATLTVTDDDGASASASVAITVEPAGGECGDTSSSSSASGSLYGWYADDEYTFTSDLDDPCQVTFTLEGPWNADFDLYVTFDGRTPSPYDYDARSITYGSDEQIIVEDVDPDQSFGILVDAYSGNGSYTLTADEIGK